MVIPRGFQIIMNAARSAKAKADAEKKPVVVSSAPAAPPGGFAKIVKKTSGGSYGGGSTQTTQNNNIPFVTPTERLIAQATGQPSENIEKAKTEIALLGVQQSAPKVMTPQGARELAIKKEVYAGRLPVGYGNVQSRQDLTKEQGLNELRRNNVNVEEYNREWHPETKIVKIYNPETKQIEYRAEFPYAGAEYYGSYKQMLNAHPELPALRAVTSPYLNVDLALADQKEREKIMIQYLHEMKGSPTGGPDLIRGISTIAGSPFVTISTSALGGMGLGKATAMAAAKFATKPVILGGLKLGVGAAGAGFGALAVKDVYDVSIEKGIGAGIGKGITAGLSFSAAGSGFKTIKPKIPENISWGYKTEKIGSVSEIKGIQVKGVPSEKMRLELSELTAFKKTGESELNIYFPGEKPSSSYGFMVKKASPQLIEDEIGLSSKFMSKMESISYKKIQSKPKDIMAFGQKVKGVVVGRRLSFFKEEMGKPLGGIAKTVQKEIPGSIFRTEVESPVIGYNIAPRIGIISTSGFIGHEKLRNPIIDIKQDKEKRVVPFIQQISEQAVNKKLGIDRVSVPAKSSDAVKIVIQSQDKARIQIMDLSSISKQKTKQISEMNRTTTQENYLYSYLSVPRMYGRGGRGWDYKIRSMDYKFRKASIKLPFSMAPRKVRF